MQFGFSIINSLALGAALVSAQCSLALSAPSRLAVQAQYITPVDKVAAQSPAGFTTGWQADNLVSHVRIEAIGKKNRYTLKLTNKLDLSYKVALGIYRDDKLVNWVYLQSPAHGDKSDCYEGPGPVINDISTNFKVQPSL